MPRSGQKDWLRGQTFKEHHKIREAVSKQLRYQLLGVVQVQSGAVGRGVPVMTPAPATASITFW